MNTIKKLIYNVKFKSTNDWKKIYDKTMKELLYINKLKITILDIEIYNNLKDYIKRIKYKELNKIKYLNLLHIIIQKHNVIIIVDKQEKDLLISGKYLITAVRHIIKLNSPPQFVTVLEISKDSVSGPLPSASQTPDWKNLVNGIENG